MSDSGGSETGGTWVVSWPFRYAYPLFLVLFGASFLLSVLVEYFFPPAAWLNFPLFVLLIPVLLFSGLVASLQLIWLVRGLFKSSLAGAPGAAVRICSLLAFMVFVGCLAGTFFVSGWLIKRIEDRGDKLVRPIQAYTDEHGHCPKSPAQLGAATGNRRLGSSYRRFKIFPSPDGTCLLYFERGLYGYCGRNTGPGRSWYCN